MKKESSIYDSMSAYAPKQHSSLASFVNQAYSHDLRKPNYLSTVGETTS